MLTKTGSSDQHFQMSTWHVSAEGGQNNIHRKKDSNCGAAFSNVLY